MTIYPIPKQMERSEGQFAITKTALCTLPKDFSSDEILIELWGNFTFGTCALQLQKTGKENEIRFGEITDTIDLKGSEYAILVQDRGALLKGDSNRGILHAFFSFLQLIKPITLEDGKETFAIPCCEIYDAPEVTFRATHLCVFPETKLSFLKKTVRLCAFLKYTHIVIEFWGTLRYDCMAELAWDCAFTKEEIKPIIDEAKAMGVELIPMFNHLGHATASRCVYGKHVVLDQNPKKALLFEPDGWTWCISNPETKALLQQIRRELAELFEGAHYFHIGCDEAYSFATCDKCAGSDKLKLLADFINEVAADLKGQGLRPIFWADTLLDHTTWKAPYIASSRADQGTHNILPLLDRDIILDDWQYDTKSNDVLTAKHLSESGFDIFVSPFDNAGNIKALAEAAIQNKKYGFLGTTWHTLNDRYGMLLYAAQYIWSGKSGISNFYDTETAKFVRLLSPVKGDYTEAGWKERQI